MRRIPLSTYRLQLHRGFPFEDALKVADYLKDLGVSHVYCSPYLQAAPGSMHGYDVVDHQKINDELGGEDGHRQFCQRLHKLGLGQVLDIVPNHMAMGKENRYWWDVLENGPSSQYATWFDIDWRPVEKRLLDKILIPVLGDQYGRVLSAGQIKVEQNGERFQVRYMDNLFPVTPRSLCNVLSKAAGYAYSDTLSFIADSFSRLPSPESNDSELAIARHRDKTVIYGLLKRLCDETPEVLTAIARAVGELNGDCEALDQMLNQQQYRLAYWKTAAHELGYRRFFDVNTLVGLRMERPLVFDATHERILEWLANGVLDGVRVDHPDGLRDPAQYFERLRNGAPDAWIIGEKILERGEYLRESWPIEGTSGYDFMNVCNSLLVQRDGLIEMSEIYHNFANESQDYETLVHETKLNVELDSLGSDVERLTSLFVEICENNRDRRDYTRTEIRRALREVGACFAVYRTYVVPERDQIVAEDRAQIDMAVSQAKKRTNDPDPGILDFIGDVLALRSRGGLETEFLLRFQQFTSPVMAKGVEDTAFYRYNRMIGLNEVGGAPDSKGLTVSEFHDYCAKMQATHPHTMTTLSTHDTKRSDDVRARLAAITEIPDQWKTAVSRWSSENAAFRTGDYPDRNTEYFLYQSLVGVWPISKERLVAYMEKAAREAKKMTSWSQPDKEFEEALKRFIDGILESQKFVSELDNFVGRILEAGRINSLSQTLLKFTAPGVPDTYQGSELWDLSLVDPDNRRPVDYELRRKMLSDLQGDIDMDEIMREMNSGLPKLLVVHRALLLRRDHPEWFGAEGTYMPIVAEGAKCDHLIGYTRADSIAVFVPRWPLKLGSDWAETSIELRPGRWRNIFTNEEAVGGKLRVQALLHKFPVALLIRERSSRASI